MTPMPEPLIVTIRGRAPQVRAEAWIAPNASVIGQVSLAARASVWYGATLRAEAEPIEIGFGTNIQDGVTIHVDAEFPVSVGAGVSVGHNAVLHGCVVEDDCLIGMGAVILNGAQIGKGSLTASALVPQGMVVPPRSLVTGVPGGSDGSSATPRSPTTAITRRSTSGSSNCTVPQAINGHGISTGRPWVHPYGE